MFRSKTPPIKEKDGSIKAGSIASLEKIILGGVKQWILIRGHNTENPILLFLHGGPGTAEMPLRECAEDLEEYFICVNWDQRDAGKSFSWKIAEESMTIEQFVSDAYELILMLINRFRREKIFLMGHSWGCVLGMKLIHQYPDSFMHILV